MIMFSVVMPVYNGERFLREAIESILNQRYTDFEFFIINDGSTDRTKEIVLSYSDSRIRYLENTKNFGIVFSINRGLEAATGKYIARMDADDISLPERLEKQVSYMECHPSVGLLGTGIIVFGENTVEHKGSNSLTNGRILVDMIFDSPFCHPSVVLRKSVLDKHNFRFDEMCEKAEDYDLWEQMSHVCEMANLSEPLLKYRKHGNQVTQTCTGRQAESVRIIKKRMYHELLPELTQEDMNVLIKVTNRERSIPPREYAMLTKAFDLLLALNRVWDKTYLKEQLRKINSEIALNVDYKVPLRFKEERKLRFSMNLHNFSVWKTAARCLKHRR